MLETINHWLNILLGQEKEAITFLQMAVRGLIVYFLTLLVIHVDKRILDINSSLDLIISIMLGNFLAMTIIGEVAFFPVLGITGLLIFLPWILDSISLYSPLLEKFLKGTNVLLVENGKVVDSALKKNSLSENDLLMALRLAGVESLSGVKKAYLENNGKISVIQQKET